MHEAYFNINALPILSSKAYNYIWRNRNAFWFPFSKIEVSIPFPHFFPQISKVHLSDDVCVSMENKRLQMIRKKKLPLNLSKKWNENIDEKKNI